MKYVDKAEPYPQVWPSQNKYLKGVLSATTSKFRFSLGKQPTNSHFSIRIDVIAKDLTCNLTLDAVGAIEIHHNNVYTNTKEISMSQINYAKSLNIFCEVLDNVQTADLTVTLKSSKLSEVAIFIYGVKTGNEHVICPPEVCDTPTLQMDTLLEKINQRSVKFIYNMNWPSMVNKPIQFSLLNLFDPVGDYDQYYVKLFATASSTNNFKLQLKYQKSGENMIPLFEGIYSGGKVYSEDTEFIVGRTQKNILINSIVNGVIHDANGGIPSNYILVIEIGGLKSMGYSGNLSGIGYKMNDVELSLPSIT